MLEASSASIAAHRLPVRAHPAFPVVIAAWFALLLGLGSLIVPLGAIGNLLALLGISSWPAGLQTAPDTSSRAAIAIGSAIVGAMAGLVLARNIAAQNRKSTDERISPQMEEDGAIYAVPDHADCPPEEPQHYTHDDAHSLPAPGAMEPMHTDEPVANPPRRRSIRLAYDDGAASFANNAPLPGGDGPAQPLRLLDLQDYADAAFVDPELANAPTPAGEGVTLELAETGDIAVTEDIAMTRDIAGTGVYNPFDGRKMRDDAGSDITARPLAELSMVELVERFALALQNRPPGSAADDTRPYGVEETDTIGAYRKRADNGSLGPLAEFTAPGLPAADPEQALRRALDRLERMSGAA